MTAKTKRSIVPVVRKIRLGEETGDAAYWRTRPYQERIDALEQIREEYHRWKGDAQSGYKEFFQLLNANQVRYLFVGGYAVSLHGYPRYTTDIDIWIDTTPDNADRILRAVDQFGLGSLGLKTERFARTRYDHSTGLHAESDRLADESFGR